MDYANFTRNQIYCLDALTMLKTMPSESVHCAVTSPPYYGLRDYGIDGQMGLEETPAEYIAKMVTLFRELRRVLRSDGNFWLNMGDSYSRGEMNGKQGPNANVGHPGNNPPEILRRSVVSSGLPDKNLLLMPHRLAIALQDDGWIVRQDNVWAKQAAMPESVNDRTTRAHEYIFHLTKTGDYWYDKMAIAEPVKGESFERAGRAVSKDHKNLTVPGQTQHSMNKARQHGDGYPMPDLRNKRSVWHLKAEPFSGAHYATFPTELPRICILAGCPEKVCPICGKGWIREIEDTPEYAAVKASMIGKTHVVNGETHGKGQGYGKGKARVTQAVITVCFHPACSCNAPGTGTGIVYDPFMGSGTTALVARLLGRDYVGSELNPEYVAIAHDRLRQPFEPRQADAKNDLSGLPLFRGELTTLPAGKPKVS